MPRVAHPAGPRLPLPEMEAGPRAPALLVLLLGLLGILIGRPTLWRAIALRPLPTPAAPENPIPASPALVVRLPTDGTHLVCESPLLYVIGPGPNRGMRPLARPTPAPRPALARAPPMSLPSPPRPPAPGTCPVPG